MSSQTLVIGSDVRLVNAELVDPKLWHRANELTYRSFIQASSQPIRKHIKICQICSAEISMAIGIQTQPCHGRAPTCRQNMGDKRRPALSLLLLLQPARVAPLPARKETTQKANLQTRPTSTLPTPREYPATKACVPRLHESIKIKPNPIIHFNQCPT